MSATHALPMDIFSPATMAGPAAGRMTLKNFSEGRICRMDATLRYSLRMLPTPKAVLASVGHKLAMKMTKKAVISLSLTEYRSSGIHAMGEMERRI